jgi:hypothetical protein
MNNDKKRSEDYFEEIASSLEHEYMCNQRLNSAPGNYREQYLYLLKSLAAFCKLSWQACDVDYRASQLSKEPKYATIEDIRAKLATMDKW